MNNKFSIILPVYNGENYILTAVDSILNQTYDNWELIIVDDGSTDDTYFYVTENYSKIAKISIYQQINSGPFIARELGVSKATGDVLLFLDADDSYKSYALEFLNNLFNEFNVDCIKYGFTAKRHDGNFDRETNFQSFYMIGKEEVFLKCIGGGLWNKAIKRICVKRYFFENSVKKLKIAEDMAFACSYLINCESCYISNEPLYNYTVIPILDKTRRIYTHFENRLDYTFVYLPFVCDILKQEKYNCLKKYKEEIVVSFFSLLRDVFTSDKQIDKTFLVQLLSHPNFEIIISLRITMNFRQKLILRLLLKRSFKLLSIIYKFVY